MTYLTDFGTWAI